ncbi:fibronectin type III domain-containing protein [Candidatus Margulisiibacteriota bacterium]
MLGKKNIFKRAMIVAAGIILSLALSFSAFAVTVPASGASTPNGKYIYIPSQSTTYGQRIKVIESPAHALGATDEVTIVQELTVTMGYPYAITVSNNGTRAFVSVSGISNSYIKAYSIATSGPTEGQLTYISQKNLGASTFANGSALTPDGNYLYVADSLAKGVHILDVSDPATGMTIVGTITPAPAANGLFGVAIKPDGTRLYVSNRETNNGKVYVYDIAGAYRTNPQIKTTLTMPNNAPASYLAVNSSGEKLFARVLHTVSPYTDVIVYDTIGDTYAVTAEAHKIKGENDRSVLPGNHGTNPLTDYDIDTNNGFEGLAIRPNGWYAYFTHFNGPTENALSYWRDSLYALGVENLSDGFDPEELTNTDIWMQWGGWGTTDASPVTPVWGGWHSTDSLVATRLNRVFYLYSDGAETFTVTTSADPNVAPTAPEITAPLSGATDVIGNVTWNPSDDDGGAANLTYSVQYILASALESGSAAWQNMGATAPGVTYLPLAGVAAGGTYYIRVLAYDGAYASGYSYSGPFAVDADFLGPPTWVSNYLVASNEVTVNWEEVPGADAYVIGYKVQGALTPYTETADITSWDTSDSNPHYRLSGLTEKTSYEVVVKAKNTIAVVESVWSPVDYFYTLERPWVTFYNPHNTEVTIVWGPEVSIATFEVPFSDHYEFIYRENGGAWTPLVKVPDLDNTTFEDPTNQNTLNFIFDILTHGSTYEVAMRTVDDTGGVSEWSSPYGGYGADPTDTVATLEVGQPHIISALRSPWWIAHKGVTTATGTIEIFWDPIPMTQEAASSYILSVGTDPLATNEVEITGIATSERILDSADLTLVPFTTYYMKVKADYGVDGVSNWSSVESFVFMDSPDWISHYGVGFTQADLTWDPVSSATYEVSYGVTDAANDATWAPTPTTDDSGTLTPLVANTWYWVKVRSHLGGYASKWTVTDSFYTLPSPQNFRPMNVTDTTATVTWEPVVYSAITYEVHYGTDADFATYTASTDITDVYLDISPLITDDTYYVRVRAYDDLGGYSDWAETSFVASDNPSIVLSDPSLIELMAGVYTGATVKISGSNFGTTIGSVEFNGVLAAPARWEDTIIEVAIPQGATSGNIVIHNAAGAQAATSPPFTVISGRHILDDFEGGVHKFVVDGDVGGEVTFEADYGSLQERMTSNKINYSHPGGTWGGAWGGVMPTYEAIPTAEVDLSGYAAITFWMKGDGSTNQATFELMESESADGNLPGNVEVYKYTVPIDLSNSTDWQRVVIELDPAKFERDIRWRNGGGILDLSKIQGYQMVYMTTDSTTAYHYVDYIEAGPMPVAASMEVVIRSTANGNINWVTVPYENSGIATTTDLAASIGNIIPVSNLNAWFDIVVVKTWDASTQTETTYNCMWDGANWIDFGSNAPIVVGNMYKVIVPTAANNRTWTISGDIPTAGSIQFTLGAIANGSMNWIATPAYIAGISTTTDLIASVGSTITPLVPWADVIVLKTWDASTQTETTYNCMWDGSSWNDFGSNAPINIPGPYVIGVPLNADGNIWP